MKKYGLEKRGGGYMKNFAGGGGGVVTREETMAWLFDIFSYYVDMHVAMVLIKILWI